MSMLLLNDAKEILLPARATFCRWWAGKTARHRAETERDDDGGQIRVGVLAADGQAWCVGHAVKLRALIGRCDGWMGLLRAR